MMIDYSGVVRGTRNRLETLYGEYHTAAKANRELARERSSLGHYMESTLFYEQALTCNDIAGELHMALAELDHRSTLQEIEHANG